MIEITKDTWIISDTHFGHMNMINLCGRPVKFNEILYRNWTKKIKPEDTVLHLGDLAIWNGPTMDLWHNFAADLPGKKYMIRGNHDKLNVLLYRSIGYELIEGYIDWISEEGLTIRFSHEPRNPSEPWFNNIHGHIHNSTKHREGERDFELQSGHINVSCDVMDFKPVKLGEILES